MSTFIQIETSTHVCSCALSVDGVIVINKESFEGQSHAKLLSIYVEEIMQYVREKEIRIDAVSVSIGPGSYTGLRIGVSEAKGLSYGLDKPIVAIPTLRLLASMVQHQVPKDAYMCPMIDARRMEVYASVYNSSLEEIVPTSAEIIDENSYMELLQNHHIYFVGNGAEKCRNVINHPRAHFIEDIHPLAAFMTTLTQQKFENNDFVDTAYFEPFYLKEFVVTVAKNKVL